MSLSLSWLVSELFGALIGFDSALPFLPGALHGIVGFDEKMCVVAAAAVQSELAGRYSVEPHPVLFRNPNRRCLVVAVFPAFLYQGTGFVDVTHAV